MIKHYSILVERRGIIQTRIFVQGETPIQAQKAAEIIAESKLNVIPSKALPWTYIEGSQFGAAIIRNCIVMPDAPIVNPKPPESLL